MQNVRGDILHWGIIYPPTPDLNVAAIFGPGPNMAEIFGPGADIVSHGGTENVAATFRPVEPNMAAVFGPDHIWLQ